MAALALDNSILIPLGVGSATCSKSMAVWNDAGTVGISGTDIGGAFDMMTGDLMGVAGGNVSIVSGSPSTSSLTLTLGEGDTSGEAVTINGNDCSMALGDSIPTLLGVGSATCSGSVAVCNDAGAAGIR
jgi:hypothetical protein